MRQSRKCVAAALLATACTAAEPPELRRAGEAPPRVVATFAGEVDLAAGTFAVTALEPAAGQALTELPVVRDGVPGVGPDDTVELVTEGYTMRVPDGCAPGVDAFEGIVRLRSFYVSACLRNAYAEIVQVAPATGHEGCRSAPSVPGASDALGLFSYGVLAKKGRAGDSAPAAWRFRLGDATQFTFRGRILADVAPECAAPGLPGVPAVALGGAPAGVAVEDATADGLPDLVSVSTTGAAAALEVAAATGGGRFAAPVSSALGATYASPLRTAYANVGGTAAPDVLYTNGAGTSATLVVHLAQAAGGYAAPSAYAAAGGNALALGDMDGDGDLDAVVAGTQASVFLGSGAGTFPGVVRAGTTSGSGVVLLDLSGDGRLDLVATNGRNLGILVQNGAAPVGFGAQTNVTLSGLAGLFASFVDVVALDADGDGDLDAVAANASPLAPYLPHCLARFHDTGATLAFQSCSVTLPFAPVKLAAADLDGNGSTDLAVAGIGAVAVLLADPAATGGFRLAATYGGTPSPSALVASDVDGDSLADLVVTSAAGRAHAVLLNAGGGALRAPARIAAAGATLVAPVDLDRDGDLDLAVGSTGTALATQRNGGAGAFTAGATATLPAAPVAIAAGDVNGDGNADLVAAVGGAGQVCVVAGGAEGALGAPACVAVGAVPAGIALLDLTDDGAPDAALPVGDGRVLGFRNAGGALVRDAALDSFAAAGAAGAVAADVTGDGRADLLVAGDALAVLASTGAGLAPALLAAHDAGARALAVGDVDGDRVLDAVTTGPDELQVFLGAGGGAFAFAAALPFPSPAGVALADVNGDGALDVAATSSARGVAGVLLNLTPAGGAVAFAPWVAWPAGAAGAALAAADLDGDGRADLAAADSAGGAVDVLRAVCLP